MLGLGAAWLAAGLGRRRPSGRNTYGLRRSSILSALFNAILLLVVTGGIAAEAIRRLVEPAPVSGPLVMAVAAIGIAVNGATALLFMSGAKHDLNLRGAFLHMAADALTACAPATWSRLPPWGARARAGGPAGIDPAAVERTLRALPGVSDLHDLHIWGMSTTETALTAHLVRPGLPPDDAMLRAAAATLERLYGIGHATFQVETGEDGEMCRLAPAQVV